MDNCFLCGKIEAGYEMKSERVVSSRFAFPGLK